IYWIRAKEATCWIPNFKEDDEEASKSDDQSCNDGNIDESSEMHKFSNMKRESDIKEVAETTFEKEQSSGNVKEDYIGEQKITRSEDPYTPVFDTHTQNKPLNEMSMEGDDYAPNSQDDKAEFVVKKNSPHNCSKNDSEISKLISNWHGDVVLMGDFNEVRTKEERYGSMFNVLGANAFNSFISTAGLEEALLTDHIRSNNNVRESHFDYGPIPFHFFHYWFELEGFDNFVERTWNEAHVNDTNAMTKLMKKLKYLKAKIRIWVKANKDTTKNHKQSLKEEIAKIDIIFPKQIEFRAADLEINITRDEIKKAVWDCEVDKSSGLDGFSFGFFRRYWTLLENKVVQAVLYFFNYGKFPRGGNSSFIVLIPKISDAKMVKDFRPTTLIGSLYKIIAKILVNRIVAVLGDIVGDVQSAFIANQQILDSRSF
ncbi:RNA-directed DNA polymerase, eukaryota, reverse transcriptase zinc-binding domain protein, partial [Tanacetum coccineum]